MHYLISGLDKPKQDNWDGLIIMWKVVATQLDTIIVYLQLSKEVVCREDAKNPTFLHIIFKV